MKTIERSFTPNKLWERVRLSRNFATALKQIDENLAYWSRHLRTKCKARFVRLTQVLLRMRRLALHPQQRELTRRHMKVERREKVRAKKAEAAAMIDQQIKKELFSRLLKGTYPTEVVNLDKGLQNLLQNPVSEKEKEREEEVEMEEEQEQEYDIASDEIEDMEEGGDEETYPVEYVEGDYYDSEEDDDDESEEEDDAKKSVPAAAAGGAKDIEDLVGSAATAAASKKKSAASAASGKRKVAGKKAAGPVAKKKKKPYVEIEYEHETEHNTDTYKN